MEAAVEAASESNPCKGCCKLRLRVTAPATVEVAEALALLLLLPPTEKGLDDVDADDEERAAPPVEARRVFFLPLLL